MKQKIYYEYKTKKIETYHKFIFKKIIKDGFIKNCSFK